MVDFNLDDPLGDLLSDGSNDSFFETKPTKPSTKPSSSGLKSTSKMEDLFGIKDETKSAPRPIDIAPSPSASTLQLNKKSDPQAATSAVIPKAEPKRAAVTPKKTTQKEISFDDDDDPLFDLGFDPKNVKSTAKKSNILDDLLGISEKIAVKPKTPISRPNTSVSRQSTIEQPEPNDGPQSGSYISSVSRQRPSSIKRQGSASTTNDPLGFFTSSDADRESKKDAKPVKNLTTDWLGITSSATNTADVQQSEPTRTVSTPVIQSQQTIQPPITNLQNIFRPDVQQTSQLIATVKADQENALQSLQQQETQLLIASQMRNQEAMLLEMQKRQHSLLSQQEQNFNDLLQKQIQRQSVLEDNIRRQQERINSHIQMLMVQPDASLSVGVDGGREKTETVLDGGKENVIIELSADVKKLELEKLRLEDLLQNIKANHEQELEILEQSYK